MTLNGHFALKLFRVRQLMGWRFWLSDKTVRKCAELFGCSVSVVVIGRWTCDREIPGSTPGRYIAG